MATYNVLDEIFQGINNIRSGLEDPTVSGLYPNVSRTVKKGLEVTEVHYIGLRQTAAFNIELDCGIYTYAERTGIRSSRFNFKLTLIGARYGAFISSISDAANKVKMYADIDSIVYEVDVLVAYRRDLHKYYILDSTNTVAFNRGLYSSSDLYDKPLPIYHNYSDLSRLSPVIIADGRDRIVHDPISTEIILKNLQPYLDELYVNNKEDNTNE